MVSPETFDWLSWLTRLSTLRKLNTQRKEKLNWEWGREGGGAIYDPTWDSVSACYIAGIIGGSKVGVPGTPPPSGSKFAVLGGKCSN